MQLASLGGKHSHVLVAFRYRGQICVGWHGGTLGSCDDNKDAFPAKGVAARGVSKSPGTWRAIFVRPYSPADAAMPNAGKKSYDLEDNDPFWTSHGVAQFPKVGLGRYCLLRHQTRSDQTIWDPRFFAYYDVASFDMASYNVRASSVSALSEGGGGGRGRAGAVQEGH